MSTHIYLDQGDNLSQAMEKIRSNQSAHLIIVLPQEMLPWQNNLSFKLLFEEIGELKKTAVLVASGNAATALAKQAGFTIAPTVEEAVALRVSEGKEEPRDEKQEAATEGEKGKKQPTDSLGFVENEDIAEIMPEETEEPVIEKYESSGITDEEKLKPDDMPVVVLDEKKREKKQSGKPRFYRKSAFWILSTLAVILVGTTVFMLWYLPKATVELYVQGQSLSKQLEVTANAATLEPNSETKTIPAIALSVEEKGQKTTVATGEKTVGQKATGTVTIQNWTDDLMIFPAGTTLTITSSQDGTGLTFTTTASVTVPPQTFSIPNEGQKLYQAGTANAEVIASDVGTQYNCTASKNFAVGQTNYASFKAVNAAAFTGGSSQKIKVVSLEDQTKLLSDLSTELYDKSKKDLESQKMGDQTYDEDYIINTITDKTFDKTVGAEAAEVALSLTTKSEVLVFSQSQLKNIFSYYLTQNAPDGFKVKADDISVSVASIEKSVSGLTITATGGTMILPEIDTVGIKKTLLGVSPDQAEEKLKSIENIIGFRVELWPPLPKILQSFPHREERLIVNLVEKDGTSGN